MTIQKTVTLHGKTDMFDHTIERDRILPGAPDFTEQGFTHSATPMQIVGAFLDLTQETGAQSCSIGSVATRSGVSKEVVKSFANNNVRLFALGGESITRTTDPMWANIEKGALNPGRTVQKGVAIFSLIAEARAKSSQMSSAAQKHGDWQI